MSRPRRFPVPADTLQPVALTYAIDDYMLAEDEPPSAEVEAFESLGHPGHYRMLVSKAYGAGHAEFCGIADGFFIHIADMAFAAPFAMSVSAPDMLRVRIASDGDGEYAAARGDMLDIKGPGAAIIIEPPGLPPAEAVFAGRHRVVHVYIHRDALKLLYARNERELPAMLQAFLAGNLQRTVARRLPLDPDLLRCLERLHGCALKGHSRRLFIQSKAVEILCHAFEVLGQDEQVGFSELSPLTTRGVLKAQQLLMENFITPPSLEDLAGQVGLSRSGLCASFRQIVGQTVFDYIADLRMQHALALLNQRNSSITQIAYAVGYHHPSSFSVAVQRRFGTSPSELRRRGLPTV
ncbi:helix-turn-helix transcriptional regulator [Sphingopyxis panaciterrae]